MNSLQVSVAVSAVASAFHSGAELLKQLKKQRKKRRGEEAFREKALLESLENGETQIEQRYAQDCQELGQSVRIGDAIARERLLHIAVSLQSDVIRSLQIATRNDSAVVDLTALHEASVMLRRDTLTALAELRQRAFNDMPSEYRQRLNSDAAYSPSTSSIQRSSLSNSQRSRSSTNYSDNLPPAVTILNTEEKPKSVLSRVFSHRRSSSALTSQSSNSSNSEKRNSGYNLTSNFPWMSDRTPQEHQDMVSPQTHELPAEVPVRLRPPMDPPPPPAYSPSRFNRSPFDSDRKFDPTHFPDSPRPIHPLERESMDQQQIEALSLDAAVQAPPSVVRTSADVNEAFNQCLGSLRLDQGLRPTSWLSSSASISSSSHYSTSENATGDNVTISSANCSGDDCASLAVTVAPPRQRHSYTSIQNSSPFSTEPPPNELTSPPCTATTMQSHNRAFSAPTVTVIPPPPQTQAPPVLSPSAPVVPMLGRPCKANNYYNFCKGAWSLREEFKKGLTTRNKPVGMYTSCLVWQCKECNFEGPSFGNKKPYTTDPRTYTFVHERAGSGMPVTVKYKWLFLAKSHVKIKSGLLRPTATENEQTIASLNGFLGNNHHQAPSSCDLSSRDNSAVDDGKYLHKPGYSYGCSFCCAEGRVTSVYGTAETLLGHVAEAHAGPAVAGRQQLSADALARTKCVIGRAPEKSEEWDVWFPGFQAQGVMPLAF
ncbi:uncharacterized protein BKCO1_3300012 [Diplodia corticola]|uniref:Uncharacterized protein n=1 Tax=Diplodia corticola TaxID=236234 RepID=A0A1J9RZA0_9PEZI|nr:uncharacterized protein BKCO1_3300012 [Diplodia corticola]OJD33124.1 hypothetical protein BKCO1_3300012 [Diplodia corticola]